MTIEREEPGVYRATCDGCGDARLLDTDGREPIEFAEVELFEIGWTARPVATVKFPDDRGVGRKVEYREHDCPDCA